MLTPCPPPPVLCTVFILKSLHWSLFTYTTESVALAHGHLSHLLMASSAATHRKVSASAVASPSLKRFPLASPPATNVKHEALEGLHEPAPYCQHDTSPFPTPPWGEGEGAFGMLTACMIDHLTSADRKQYHPANLSMNVIARCENKHS